MRRSSRNTHQTSSQLLNGHLGVPSSPKTQDDVQSSTTEQRKSPVKKRTRRDASDDDFKESNNVADTGDYTVTSTKKRKTVRSGKGSKETAEPHKRLFGLRGNVSANRATCSPPTRLHSLAYHRPLLLDEHKGRASLLDWFDAVSTKRSMPWRKTWVDPRTFAKDAASLRQQLERRAYEVWISEIMLQQTRVAVVIDYWNRWMAKWPTIHNLAASESDEVLASWRGLGYYSRATRIHEAAKLVCKQWEGLLPSAVDDLVANVPGVGRYTAGAISAIVFGRAAPMVDGNVLRVLSRQLGLFGDVKTDKTVIETLWAAADALVKAVAWDSVDDDRNDSEEPKVSDGPGRWGQALMELGSTVCTPKPNCSECPITSTCRAYSEGVQLASKKGLVPEGMKPADVATEASDIEDSCNLCKPFEELALNEGDDEMDGQTATENKAPEPKPKSKKQATLQAFAFMPSIKSIKTPPDVDPPSGTLGTAAIEIIATHARKFPVKTIKKAVREEETIVCAIRRSDGKYLIHKRPEKGLLAGLWEFPSYILPDTSANTQKARKKDAERFVSSLSSVTTTKTKLKHTGELGTVPWLFSHLKLTMHVHLFELDQADDLDSETPDESGKRSRWSDAVDEESMGTGMRKCWTLVKEAGDF